MTQVADNNIDRAFRPKAREGRDKAPRQAPRHGSKMVMMSDTSLIHKVRGMPLIDLTDPNTYELPPIDVSCEFNTVDDIMIGASLSFNRSCIMI